MHNYLDCKEHELVSTLYSNTVVYSWPFDVYKRVIGTSRKIFNHKLIAFFITLRWKNRFTSALKLYRLVYSSFSSDLSALRTYTHNYISSLKASNSNNTIFFDKSSPKTRNMMLCDTFISAEMYRHSIRRDLQIARHRNIAVWSQ